LINLAIAGSLRATSLVPVTSSDDAAAVVEPAFWRLRRIRR
jgi:hypothetical protein